MGDIRVDLDTATRDKLVAEIVRLHEVCERWSRSWHGIVNANTQAWIEQVQERDERIAMLERLLNREIESRKARHE